MADDTIDAGDVAVDGLLGTDNVGAGVSDIDAILEGVGDDADQTEPKRGPGRPPGYPKTGGRRKGTPNKDRAATLEAIRSYSDPIGFLEKVCRGLLIECRDPDADDPKAAILTRPSMEQRITAATILSKKVLPDCRAVELDTAGDGALTINVIKQPHGPSGKDKAAPADQQPALGRLG